jgi:hypothetical protein
VKGVSYLSHLNFYAQIFIKKGSPRDFSPGLPEEKKKKIYYSSIMG